MAALGGLFPAAVIAGASVRHSSRLRLVFTRRSIYLSNHTFRKALEGTSTVLQLHSRPALRRLQNRRYLGAANTAMASELKESAQNNPGLCEITDEATKGYFVQQTMYRVKDPKISLDFYSRILGMKLLKRFDFPDAKFSLYFMGYEDTEDAPNNEVERTIWTFKCKATLELTHNWGTESDPEFKGYHNGNSEPRGYGHIGITVDDTYKACERFEKLGVEFAKRPDDGRMKGLAFIKDPDGYWIEIFDLKGMDRITSSAP